MQRTDVNELFPNLEFQLSLLRLASALDNGPLHNVHQERQVESVLRQQASASQQ